MQNLYDTLTHMLRDYWKAHGGSYPEAIELTPEDLKALLQARKLVNESMNFRLQQGWDQELLGVPLRAGQSNCLVTEQGERLPVQQAADPSTPGA